MYILHYDEVPDWPLKHQEFRDLLLAVEQAIFRQYGYYDEKNKMVLPSDVEHQVLRFLAVSNKRIDELKILDLGCGSRNTYDNLFFNDRDFEPWLCRFLHAAGADVVGIDCASNHSEKFKNYEMHIQDLDLSSVLTIHSIDVANAHGLFNSPTLMIQENGVGGSCLGLLNGTGKRIFESVKPQLERIVKPEGYFLYSGI